MPPRRRPRRVLLRLIVVWIVTARGDRARGRDALRRRPSRTPSAALASAALISARQRAAVAAGDPAAAADHGAHARARRARAQRRRGAARRVAGPGPARRLAGRRDRDARSSSPWSRPRRRRCSRSTTTSRSSATSSSARRSARRRRGRSRRCPGLLLLEIDGLAHDVILRAMRDGNAPTMARWLREGGYRLTRWETDWSSQTGACQAGLLHGDNDDMPAFRWWEKDRSAAIVTNHPKDAAELERRHSDGRGLLHADGASRANILSGDAAAQPADDEHGACSATGPGGSAPTTSPTSRTRTTSRARSRSRSARSSASCGAPRQQRRLDVRPRVHRGFTLRADARVGDGDPARPAGAGRDRRHLRRAGPSTYTTFLAYDEVAHHSGVERPETLLDPAPRRPRARRGSPRRPPTRRGRTGSWCSPTTASRRARRSWTATGSRSSSSSRRPPARTRSRSRAAATRPRATSARASRRPRRATARPARAVRRVTRGRAVEGQVLIDEPDARRTASCRRSS